MVKCIGCGLDIDSDECDKEHNIRRTIVQSLEANVAPPEGVNRYFVGRNDMIKKILKKHIKSVKDLNVGSMIYLLGPYGSGKTTTLKMLKETSCELPGSFVYSSIIVKDFSQLGDNLHIYKEIVKNLTTTGDIRGISNLLNQVTSLYPSKGELRSELLKRNMDNRISNLVLHYSDNNDIKRNVVLEWFSGNPEIRADDLHLIGKRGFQRIKEDDIDVYLSGLNCLSKMIGTRGLLILIDEGVDPKAEIKDIKIDAIWQNLKYYYNNLYSEPKFPGMIIAICGTLDLWDRLIIKDEAFRQRLESAVKEELKHLNFNDYVQLFQKLINIWDCVFQTNINSRVSTDDLERWVKIIESKKGGFEHMTVREALGVIPKPKTSFLRKLEYLVDNKTEIGKNVFK